MLALTKRTEYALIALCHLARRQGTVASARDIADEYAVRLPLLMNVLKALNRSGLLRSMRGVNGGYAMKREPQHVTLAEVIEAVEGPLRLVRCVPPLPEGEAACELLCTCPVRTPVRRVHEYLNKFLAGVTVAELAFDEGFGAQPGQAGLKVLAQ